VQRYKLLKQIFSHGVAPFVEMGTTVIICAKRDYIPLLIRAAFGE